MLSPRFQAASETSPWLTCCIPTCPGTSCSQLLGDPSLGKGSTGNPRSKVDSLSPLFILG